MSIGTISCVGKNNSISGSTVMNIIHISNSTVIPTKLVFLSNRKVENFSDFLDVMDYYGNLGLSLTLVSGEYVTGTAPTRYDVIDVFLNNGNEIRLTYRGSGGSWYSEIIAYISQTPSDWSYFNVEF